MWKALKTMFAAGENSGQIIQGAMKGIDALVFTEEEQAGVRQASIKAWIAYLQATLPMNVSRRFIAITITLLFSLNFIAFLLFSGMGVLLNWVEAAKFAEILLTSLQTVIGPLFGLVAGFYFWKGVKDKQSLGKFNEGNSNG